MYRCVQQFGGFIFVEMSFTPIVVVNLRTQQSNKYRDTHTLMKVNTQTLYYTHIYNGICTCMYVCVSVENQTATPFLGTLLRH